MAATRNRLRIIAGEWRGRRLAFPAAGGLRPTGERVRETLFNWLQAEVAGARCLDLFAGSGALGLEAASRGAREVVLVERSARVAAALRENVRALDADGRIRVLNADVRRFLAGQSQPYDLVFLDPPFRSAIIGPVCTGLEAGGWLATDALVYVEADSHRALPPLPDRWAPVRKGVAGGVAYRLYRRQ